MQSVGYLIDVYNDKISPETNFFKFFLFISYFPTIIQGPISKYGELSKELFKKNAFNFNLFRNGLILVLFGFVKKMVIADRIGIFANYCFDNYVNLSGIILYIGAISYAFQLYFDFSGCVDICRGISKFFGIEITQNFNRPYLSKSIKEFWGRWHISLSNWFKNYIYIPLGGNRKGNKKKYLNILIVFLISGIWHGAGFSFIFWGLLHAIYQIIGYITHPFRNNIKKIIKLKNNTSSDTVIKAIITFNLVSFTWIFFRSTSLMSAFKYIYNMLFINNISNIFDGTIYTMGINQFYMFLLLIHIFIIFLIESKFSSQEEVVSGISELHIILRWLIYFILIFDILLYGVYGSGFDLSSFMYGGF